MHFMKIKYMKIFLSVVFNSCHPMDCSLPGSSVHGIFQANTGKYFPNKYWNELPFLSLGDLPNLGMKPFSPSL